MGRLWGWVRRWHRHLDEQSDIVGAAQRQAQLDLARAKTRLEYSRVEIQSFATQVEIALARRHR